MAFAGRGGLSLVTWLLSFSGAGSHSIAARTAEASGIIAAPDAP